MVLIYTYIGVSISWPLCVVCLCLVCVISNENSISKFDALLCKTLSKVLLVLRYQDPRIDMCRSITSLSKIKHQMWHNHPFSQRKKVTKRSVRLGKFWENGVRGGRQYRGGLQKIGGFRNPLPTKSWKYYFFS